MRYLPGSILTHKNDTAAKYRVVSCDEGEGHTVSRIGTNEPFEKIKSDEFERDPVIDLRVTETTGVGMFSGRPVKQGELIWEEDEGGKNGPEFANLCFNEAEDSKEGRLVANGFGDSNQIFFTISRVNHSCNPNCQVVVRGCTATLHACIDVPIGTEITISYIDLLCPASERCAQLKDNFHFSCLCESCSAASPSSDARRVRLSDLFSLGPTLSLSTPEVPLEIRSLLMEEGLHECFLWSDCYRFYYVCEEDPRLARGYLEDALRFAVLGGGPHSEQSRELTQLLEDF